MSVGFCLHSSLTNKAALNCVLLLSNNMYTHWNRNVDISTPLSRFSFLALYSFLDTVYIRKSGIHSLYCHIMKGLLFINCPYGRFHTVLLITSFLISFQIKAVLKFVFKCPPKKLTCQTWSAYLPNNLQMLIVYLRST